MGNKAWFITVSSPEKIDCSFITWSFFTMSCKTCDHLRITMIDLFFWCSFETFDAHDVWQNTLKVERKEETIKWQIRRIKTRLKWMTISVDHSVGKFVYRYTTSSFTQSRTTILIYSKNGGRSIFETKMMKILNTKDVLPVYRTSQYFQQHRKQTSYDNHDVRFFCIFLKDLGTKKNTLTIDYNKG